MSDASTTDLLPIAVTPAHTNGAPPTVAPDHAESGTPARTRRAGRKSGRVAGAGATARPSAEMRACLAALREAIPNRSKRWQPTRLIVQNLFHVTYQEFYFADGRMALNGANGTGKSTIACLALPIVLDMVKARQRFDPFGGRERNPAYLLLGSPKAKPGDPGFYDTRTAYAALEFQHGATNAFITIGVGLYATRASGPDPKIESWGFVAPDRRIGDDFALMTPDGDPLSRRELADLLGSTHVFERNGDYQQAVNAALFGFEHAEDLPSLTSDIFEIKKPKLERPDRDALDASLRGSLPSLPVEVTDRLADLIAKIEHAADMLAETQAHVTLVTELDTAQGNYANQRAQEAAVRVQAVAGDIATARRLYEAATETLRTVEHERDGILAQIDATSRRLQQDEGAHDVLRNSDAYKSVESQEAIASAYARATADEERAAKHRERGEQAIVDLREKRERLDEVFFQTVAELQGRAEAIAQAADEVSWARVIPALEAYRLALQPARLDAVTPDPVDALDESLIRADSMHRVRALSALATAMEKANAAAAAVAAADAQLYIFRDELAMANAALVAADTAFVTAESQAIAAVETAVEAARGVLDLRDQLAEVTSGVRTAAGTRSGLDRALQPMLATLADAELEQATMQRLADRDVREWEHTVERLTSERNRWAKEPFARPPARDGSAAARQRLAEAGIVAVPFYEAVEVRADADAAVLARVEASLLDAGLLDALLLRPEDVARAGTLLRELAGGTDAERWFLLPDHSPSERTARTAAAPSGTLLDLLVPAQQDAADAQWSVTVTDVLASLASGPGAGTRANALGADGSWRHGLLAGQSAVVVHGSTAPVARFLGITNRRRHRDAELARLATALEDAEAQRLDATERYEQSTAARAALEALARTLRDLPALRDLEGAARERAQAVEAESRANRRLTEANARVQALRVALLEANAVVQGASEDFPELRHATPARVTEVRHATLRITSDCAGLAAATSVLDDLRTRAEELADRVQEEEERLEEHTEDVRRTRGDATRLKAQLETIERSLAGTDAATLRAQVAALSTRISEARDELGTLQTRNGRNESDVTKAKAEVMRLRDALVEAEGRIHAATHEFEVRLKAYPEEAMRRALELFDQAGGQGGPIAAAAELLKKRKLGAGLADNVEDRNKRAGNQLVQAFHAHKVELNKYRPEISEDNWVTLVMVSDGRRLNPSAFLQRLHVIEEEQGQVVSAAEHDLYVKFFLGDVLQHLRRRMLLATDFVSRVDDILKGMHLSNGARFRLTWTPKAEEGVGAVNYTDLVTFVQADPETVSPARLTAMMTAFQQRLETVRAEQKGQSKESYRERLAAEFDYRSWFEFRFFFKNANDPEVELKGRAIETLSGGERTAAQILPLLACLHARSLGARPDAPKLMGLDEAFAGTDAQNMEKMLSIFVDLEFSYILVGDKITGDSRVVPACATYNLLARGTVITPVLYLWDGTRRARMSEETLRRDAALRQANDLAAAHSIAAVVGTVPQDETRESVEVLPLFTRSTA